jgi:hypothetical protein
VSTRTLLEQARNTIAFLKQTLEEKGIVYDINALNSLSKGMAGSKWSLMEELERRLLEILQDKSKSREEMKVRWPDPMTRQADVMRAIERTSANTCIAFSVCRRPFSPRSEAASRV